MQLDLTQWIFTREAKFIRCAMTGREMKAYNFIIFYDAMTDRDVVGGRQGCIRGQTRMRTGGRQGAREGCQMDDGWMKEEWLGEGAGKGSHIGEGVLDKRAK